ncbi:gamma-tubulin complex component 2-like isoform X2 [Planococcus citri]|uniref:gamma-tubulin complex component 2-like isoform X2 n=1 Tax=Planococcus citri TaxID=170843 RepID=UPI0031F860D2
MSEYFLYSAVKDFLNRWSCNVSSEEYLQKLLHYQDRYVNRNVVTSQEHYHTVASRSPNSEQFLQKYAQLDSGRTDLLPKFLTLLSLLQTNKGLSEEMHKIAIETSNKPAKMNLTMNSRTFETHEDVEKVIKELTTAAAEVEEKKSKSSFTIEKKDRIKKFDVDLTIWKQFRPFLSADFSNNTVISNLLPIGAVPRSSQEKYLVRDVLQCLLGFHGKYICGTREEEKDALRKFVLEQSIYSPFKSIVSEILVLAEYYSTVIRFIEERHQFSSGRVNQALCEILENILQDYRVFIIQLETKQRQESLTLQSLLFCIQPFLETMSCLARIVHAINKAEARGGRTLSLLHDAGKQNAIEHKAADILVILIRSASVPYFEALEQWIHTGYINDPCDEFMIEDNVEAERQNILAKGEFTNEYWKKRYRIKKDHVPTFLSQYQQKILRTGKYLNTIKQCKNISSKEMNSILERKPTSNKMCYTSLNSCEFVQSIEAAYNFASDTLLNLLLNEYDILNRLKSVKRFFLIEQGDFISITMDLCEEELSKPVTEIMSTRLTSLMELAIRTCSCAKTDPYKNDISIETVSEDFVLQVFRINAINTKKEKELMRKNPEKDLIGLDVVTLHLNTAWPVSLIFNEKVIGCYQILFRFLLYCKYVERLLCKVWICDQQFKTLEKDSRKYYLRAFALRRKMVLFVQNLSYYMTNEVIEQHWFAFLNIIKKCQNIDDFMHHHWVYLNNCMNDCMLTSSKLIKPLMWLLKNCVDFCNFIQNNEKARSSKKSPSSFEERIKIFEFEFNNNLGILLKLIPLCGIEECSNQLLHFLNRQNFNGYYTNLIGCPTTDQDKKKHNENNK